MTDLKPAIEFLSVSCSHLEASKLLNENKFYPQSIYFLQQSVEMASKSYSLFSNDLKEEELKTKINHKSQTAFKRIYQNSHNAFKEEWENIQKKFPNIDIEKLEFYEYIQTTLKAGENLDEHFESENKNYDNLSESLLELENIIQEVTKEETLSLLENIDEVELKKVFEKIRNFITQFTNETISKELIQELEKIPLNVFKGHIRSVYAIVSFNFVASTILLKLSNHLSHLNFSTRYPNTKLKHNPILTFNSNHPLVTSFGRIYKLIGQAQYCLGNIYEISNP
ncbi:MAG: hypothetical protein WC150_14370 [Bacteroidia bacterium]